MIRSDYIIKNVSILGVQGRQYTVEQLVSNSNTIKDAEFKNIRLRHYLFEENGLEKIIIKIFTSRIDNVRQCYIPRKCFHKCIAKTIKLTGEAKLTFVGDYWIDRDNTNPDCFKGCTHLVNLVLDFPEFGDFIETQNEDGTYNFLLNSSIARGTGYIYVPDALVDTVKTLSGWSTYAGQIKPLSEYVE